MKTLNAILVVALFASIKDGYAQGFLNLNFENADVAGYSPGSSIPTTNAIPDWTAYISGTPQSSVLYDNATLGAAAVSLQGTNGVYPPLQGLYSVLLQATFFSSVTNTAAVGQTGTIPDGTQSLVFWANTSLSGAASNMEVSFDGSSIFYSAIGSGSGYTIYGADISALAGDTGQLLFTAYNNTYAEIDNIQFSTSPIPEPSEFALAVFGGLLFAWRRWKKQSL